MSDIFRDYSFGGWLRSKRVEKGITLRKMALSLGVDSGNYCKIERSSAHPPATRKNVIKLLKPLNLDEQTVNFMIGLALEAKLSKCREDFLK